MFLQTNGYLTKELHRANKCLRSLYLQAALQQRLYPVCPQLRQKHWLEGGKHNAASLNLNLKPEVILEFLNKESEDLRS